MRLRRASILTSTLLALSLLSTPSVHGSTTADFLRVTPDAQSAALGNSGVANAGSGFAAHHNPSLLSMAPHRARFSGAQARWILGVQAAHYAASFRTAGKRPWGFGVNYSDWRTGAFAATDPYGNPAGQVEFKASNVGAAASRAVTEWLHVGVGVKQISQSFVEDGGNNAQNIGAAATAWDFGATYRSPWRQLTFAAALKNVGGKTKFLEEKENLPSTLSAGVEGRFFEDRMAWTVELSGEGQNDLKLRSGFHFSPLPLLALRAGYNAQSAGDPLAGLTSGVGLRFKNVDFDYSFAPLGELGVSQRASVTWKVGPVK